MVVVEVSAVEATSAAAAAGLDQLEAVVVFAALAFVVALSVVPTWEPRCSVARAEPLEWERAEAELVSAYRATLHLGRVRHISSLSIPDELADRWLRLFAQQQRLVGRRIVSAHLGQLHNAD
jgi:hypothetical protein